MADLPRLGVVDRVDRPLPGVYALSLRGDASRVLLLFAGPPRGRPAWALASERPRGPAADAAVRGVRERLEGARVVRATIGRTVTLALLQGEREIWVAPERGGLSIEDAIPGMVPEGRALDPADLDEAASRAGDLLGEQAKLLVGAKQRALASALAKVLAKLERRVAAIEADLARAGDADRAADDAALFVAAAAKARTGTTELRATDWSSGEPVERVLALDPAVPPRDQLDRVFARAKRLRAGAVQARARKDEAETLALLVLEARDEIERATDEAALDALSDRLAKKLPRDLLGRANAPARERAKQERPRPHRVFQSSLGSPIFVGKDAASNDLLTVTVARPGDLWLHARDTTGAHVVAPGWFKSGRLDQETLLDAATLAAHFSALRGEPVVDVCYADRRHVRKRRGAARGSVEVTKEKVLPLRVEEARLARLLASERP